VSAPRLRLAHLPTPLVASERASRLVGVDLWLKRDDATGGAEAGNKLRKLEYLLAAALDQGADTVVTCGALQSNHARATAIAAASLGLRSVLLLRTSDPAAPLPHTGNVLLDRLVGAEIRLVTPAEYRQRGDRMDAVAAELAARGRRAYVIPEGGSNGLGSLGYVEAMREVRAQIDAGDAGAPARFDLVVHACGSGGTAAGVALGVAATGVAAGVRAMAVCDDRAYFEATVARIAAEARALDPSLPAPAACDIDDASKGPAYGVPSDAQRAFVVRAAREAGLLLDPVYTGKALFGLAEAVRRGEVPRAARVLFVHTGGLPGLLAQGDVLAPELG
jgi:D-cysteine desulfhydrase